MERESFEDPATAARMNQGFVNIKVDREERPDLDSIYMKAVQVTTGRGGWPLTAFLTPAGRFFYGGTYYPPEPRFGMPSFQQVLAAVLDAFRNRRDEVERGAVGILRTLKGMGDPGDAGAIPEVVTGEAPGGNHSLESRLAGAGPSIVRTAAGAITAGFDPLHGGFAPAPKFPQPVTLEFLLRFFSRAGGQQGLDMVLRTLRAMARGGIRDHLGGGFHRYSVDARWLVPHFEKMLYDNGLLARVYLHAFQLTGEEELRKVVTSTLDYLLEDLRSPEGGFFSARDADSGGEEGTFYLWTPDQVAAVLGEEDGAQFCRAYDVTGPGNFEGRNILNRGATLGSGDGLKAMGPDGLDDGMGTARSALLAARRGREHPFRDEKVLVAWNSFVLAALAEAGPVLHRPDYILAAVRNAEFLLGVTTKDGGMARSWTEGRAGVSAFLEDYAGLGNALLTLFESTLEPRWLLEARRLGDEILDRFWEEEDGVFYDASREAEALVMRPREVTDNATPSGNSLAVELLLRLHSLYGVQEYREIAVRTLLRGLKGMASHPSAFGGLLASLDRALEPPLEVVLLGDPEDPGLRELMQVALRPYLPDRVVVGGDPGRLPELPVLKGRTALEGAATALVCSGFACSLVTRHGEELREELATRPQRP